VVYGSAVHIAQGTALKLVEAPDARRREVLFGWLGDTVAAWDRARAEAARRRRVAKTALAEARGEMSAYGEAYQDGLGLDECRGAAAAADTAVRRAEVAMQRAQYGASLREAEEELTGAREVLLALGPAAAPDEVEARRAELERSRAAARRAEAAAEVGEARRLLDDVVGILGLLGAEDVVEASRAQVAGLRDERDRVAAASRRRDAEDLVRMAYDLVGELADDLGLGGADDVVEASRAQVATLRTELERSRATERRAKLAADARSIRHAIAGLGGTDTAALETRRDEERTRLAALRVELEGPRRLLSSGFDGRCPLAGIRCPAPAAVEGARVEIEEWVNVLSQESDALTARARCLDAEIGTARAAERRRVEAVARYNGIVEQARGIPDTGESRAAELVATELRIAETKGRELEAAVTSLHAAERELERCGAGGVERATDVVEAELWVVESKGRELEAAVAVLRAAERELARYPDAGHTRPVGVVETELREAERVMREADVARGRVEAAEHRVASLQATGADAGAGEVGDAERDLATSRLERDHAVAAMREAEATDDRRQRREEAAHRVGVFEVEVAAVTLLCTALEAVTGPAAVAAAGIEQSANELLEPCRVSVRTAWTRPTRDPEPDCMACGYVYSRPGESECLECGQSRRQVEIPDLQILVDDGRGEDDVRRKSGGAKSLVATALRLGAGVANPGLAVGWRVLDESFDGVDGANVDGFLAMLGRCAHLGVEQVVVVSHDDAMLEAVPAGIEVVAGLDGSSHIRGP
jgi:hypothetical protein